MTMISINEENCAKNLEILWDNAERKEKLQLRSPVFDVMRGRILQLHRNYYIIL